MSHLTDLELIAAIEDANARDLPVPRRRHLDACDACRGRADELRSVIAAAADATVPEPSPLFWEHFSARVRQGIDGSTPGSGEAAHQGRLAAWLGKGHAGWMAFAATVIILLVAGVWQVNAPSPRRAPHATVDRAADEPVDLDADPAWAVVRTVADSVEWSDAAVADIGVQPDAAETVARTLSPEERSELVRLLLAEAKRNGA